MGKQKTIAGTQVTLMGQTDDELGELAWWYLFTRHGESPYTTNQHKGIGRLWGTLIHRRDCEFNVQGGQCNHLVWCVCAKCGKRYKFNQGAWIYRHSLDCKEKASNES